MPTSTSHGSSTSCWMSSRLDPGGLPSGAVTPGATVVAARGGYAVSTGPLNAEVRMYSRQCSDRYGNNASIDGTALWMSQSITPWPRSIAAHDQGSRRNLSSLEKGITCLVLATRSRNYIQIALRINFLTATY